MEDLLKALRPLISEKEEAVWHEEVNQINEDSFSPTGLNNSQTRESSITIASM